MLAWFNHRREWPEDWFSENLEAIQAAARLADAQRKTRWLWSIPAAPSSVDFRKRQTSTAASGKAGEALTVLGAERTMTQPGRTSRVPKLERDQMNGCVVSVCTYSPLPYDGHGPAGSCATILENLPPSVASPILFTPRVKVDIAEHVTVKHTLPPLLDRAPYRAARAIGRHTVNRAFAKALDWMDPQTSVAWFWPGRPGSLITKAKTRGIVTVREMTNCTLGAAKRVLDDAYEALGVPPSHGITEAIVRMEEEELRLYDYVFAPKQVEAGLLAAGVDPARIVPSSFGWDGRRFARASETERSSSITALYVGLVCIGKEFPNCSGRGNRAGSTDD